MSNLVKLPTTLTIIVIHCRTDVKFPVRPVKIFTNNLLHDNILVRKAGFHVVDCVLKQHKRKHLKLKLHDVLADKLKVDDKTSKVSCSGDTNENGVQIRSGLIVQPGERLDNKWLQYSSDNKPLDQKSYDEPRYLQKPHCGFYTWPQEEVLYAPSDKQPKLDRKIEEMPEAEQTIFKFFSDTGNVEKLVTFLSLENKKGRDRFEVMRFGMFKALFRNFGDSFLDIWRPHIERLVTERQESHQRAAAEIIAGLVRGSKHWSYSMVSVHLFSHLPCITYC